MRIITRAKNATRAELDHRLEAILAISKTIKGENTQITKSATNKTDLLFPPARNVNPIEPTDPINIIIKTIMRHMPVDRICFNSVYLSWKVTNSNNQIRLLTGMLYHFICIQSVFSKTTLENIAVSALAGRCEQKPIPT